MSQPTPDSATAAGTPPCGMPAELADRETWFAQEIQPHGTQLKNYLRGIFPSVRDVDDVVQESYLRVWKAKATQPIQSAKAFLFKVARRLALDVIRRNKSSPVDFGYDFDATPVLDTGLDAAQALLEQDLFNHVVDVLIALPPRYRDVVVLHKLRGLSHREIAAQLKITERTAQKYCSIGLERCAKQLKSKGITGFFG